MCTWILVSGVFLGYCISFSSADGDFTDGLYTDELSMFNEDIDSLSSTSTYTFDSTDPDLISDMYFNDENSDGFDDTFPNSSDAASDSDSYSDSNSDSDQFAGSADDLSSNSVVDTTTIATANNAVDCSSITNDDDYDVLRKNKKARARVRRETACENPNSDFTTPNLSLPTLDQADNRKDPLAPKTDQDRADQDAVNEVLLRGGLFLKGADMFLRICPSDETRVCSSGNHRDIHREVDGGGNTLTDGTKGKFSPHLHQQLSGVHVQY